MRVRCRAQQPSAMSSIYRDKPTVLDEQALTDHRLKHDLVDNVIVSLASIRSARQLASHSGTSDDV